MRYKEGDTIRIKGRFGSTWEKLGRVNKWVIDHIKTQKKGYPSLYVCYCTDDKHGMLYQFTDREVEKCD